MARRISHGVEHREQRRQAGEDDDNEEQATSDVRHDGAFHGGESGRARGQHAFPT
jgi:hypothetical protein